MITEIISNTNPMAMSGVATTSQHTMFDDESAATSIDFASCFPGFRNPTVYSNKVFADVTAKTDELKTDSTSFLFSKRLNLGSVVVSMELYKEGVKIADLIDDTYGTYYGVGFSSDYPLYYGYVINWGEVLDLHGAGCYTIRNNWTLGALPTSVTESNCYYLLPYSPCNVEGTVKVKWIQNGNIESNSLRYAGLNWANWIRVKGIFWKNDATEEIDEVEKTDRSFENINVQSIDEFTLELKSSPYWITKMLDKNVCLGSQIFITDYNADNHRDDLNQFEVRFSGYGDRDEQRGNKFARYSYRFKRRLDNDLKREFPKP
jgi:hypothetical protein